ncbi:MAG: hypothetical protein M3324_08785 [Actinomycetota bacterium]|nr:hypothetical protein [Actinomycetota bacterium]
MERDDPSALGKRSVWYAGEGRTTQVARRLHLDLSTDPDAPVLRRPDGTAAARFSAWGMTKEAIEREALEDLLHGSEEPLGRGPNGPGAQGR